MISGSSADTLVEVSRSQQVWMKIWQYKVVLWDEAMLIIGALAVFVVWLGAEASYSANKGGSRRGLIRPVGEVVSLQMREAIVFIFLASIMLTFLYFAMNYVIYLLLLGFGISGAFALAHFLNLFFYRSCHLSHLIAKYLSFFLAGAVAAVWFIWRFSSWSWIPQDILCVALLVNIQMTLKIESLKIASTLLILAFFYDIFMVFVTPLFTKGVSVMETVALGGDTGESLPMLLAIPKFRDPFMSMSRIGLGDIALPGTLVSYCKRFDPNAGLTGYYWVSIFGYTVGLSITFAALVLMRLAQPALLWLVPCTLGPLVVLSYARGELGALWKGQVKPGYRLLNRDYKNEISMT